MDVIYAAEKPSIAELLGDHVRREIEPDEIKVTENPGETGSFYIDWRSSRYVLSPGGEIAATARVARVDLRGTAGAQSRYRGFPEK